MKHLNLIAIAIALLLIIIAAYAQFQLTGVRTILAIIVFFGLPFYLLLRNVDIPQDEKIFFGFFIGLGLFSTATFFVGRLIPSFRASFLIAFVVLVVASFVLPRLGVAKRKQAHAPKSAEE